MNVSLPADVVAARGVPSISGYVSSNAQTWLAVDHAPASEFTAFCGLTGVGTSTPAVTVVNAPTGYCYWIVAVF